MAHVQIRLGDGGFPTLSLIVDGVDLSNHVYTEGFGLIRVGDDPFEQEWGVSMILAVESLNIDLPNAVIKALSATDDEVAALEGSA